MENFDNFYEIKKMMRSIAEKESKKQQTRFVEAIEAEGILTDPNINSAAKKLVKIFNESNSIEISDLAAAIHNVPDEILRAVIPLIEPILHERKVELALQNRIYEEEILHAEKEGIATDGIMPSMELPGEASVILRDLKKIIEKKLN